MAPITNICAHNLDKAFCRQCNMSKMLFYLGRCFEIPKESRTLKLRKKPGFTVDECIKDAEAFLLNNKEGYTRIEFKRGPTYFVVAKLKPEQLD